MNNLGLVIWKIFKDESIKFCLWACVVTLYSGSQFDKPILNAQPFQTKLVGQTGFNCKGVPFSLMTTFG